MRGTKAKELRKVALKLNMPARRLRRLYTRNRQTVTYKLIGLAANIVKDKAMKF